ncbi:MAG: hypothetical protein DMF66_10695 [Acidobacteria bacterium]|nr:MAG: hypothetical protein DMF66_10695 [Acidobacteriota bacterium]
MLSESFAVSSRAIRRRRATCSSVSCSFAFNAPAKDESANIASRTGSVTGRLAAPLSGVGDGVALGAGVAEADGDALAAGALALVVAVLVGALVVQPEAAASKARDRTRETREIF